jgi:copper(I)-binding protein
VAVLRVSRIQLRRLRPLLALAACACAAATGCGTVDTMPIPSTVAAGNNASVGDLLVRNVFVLGPAPGQAIAAGGSAPLFVSLVNDGRAPDRLIRVTAAGVARSAAIEGGGLDTPVNRLVPGGPVPRIMLDKLVRPLRGNGSVRVTLTFRDAGTVSVDAPVMTYTSPYTTFSPSPATGATPGKS